MYLKYRLKIKFNVKPNDVINVPSYIISLCIYTKIIPSHSIKVLFTDHHWGDLGV